MSRNLLKKLYFNEIAKDPKIYLHMKNCNKIYANRIDPVLKHFKSILSEEDWKKLDDIDVANNEIGGMECYDNFVYGFKLASQLFIIGLTEKNKKHKIILKYKKEKYNGKHLKNSL